MDNIGSRYLIACGKKYYNDPIGFSKDICGFTPSKKQKEMMLNLINDKRLAVKSANGVGKTAIISVIILWFLTTRHKSEIVLSAQSYRQLQDVTYKELKKRYMASKLAKFDLFRATRDAFELNHKELRGVWRCTIVSPENEIGAQGFHNPNLLFVVDEASSLEEKFFRALSGSMKQGVMCLLCGNPNNSFGSFFEIFNKNDGTFKTMTLSYLDAWKQDQEWLDYMDKKFGKDSPHWKIRVLGEFAETGEYSIIGRDKIENSIKRDLKENNNADTKIKIGVDIGFVEDDTVISVVRGSTEIERVVVYADVNNDTKLITDKVANIIKKYERLSRNISVRLDYAGVGRGVVDNLRSDITLENIEIVGINFGERAIDDSNYNNIITEAFFEIRDKFMDGNISILKHDENERLINELSGRRYEYDNCDRFKIEKKEKYKKRFGNSPDIGDSILLAFMNNVPGTFAKITNLKK